MGHAAHVPVDCVLEQPDSSFPDVEHCEQALQVPTSRPVQPVRYLPAANAFASHGVHAPLLLPVQPLRHCPTGQRRSSTEA